MNAISNPSEKKSPDDATSSATAANESSDKLQSNDNPRATGQRWSNYAEFFRTSEYATFPQRHRGLSGRLPFGMIEAELSDHDFTDPEIPETVLALPLASVAQNRWSWNIGDGWRHCSAIPGRLLVVPAGLESRWRVEGHRKLLLLLLPTSTMQSVLGSAMPDNLAQALDSLTHYTWEDPFIAGGMKRLWRASLAQNPTDPLLAEGILMALIAHLLQRAGTTTETDQRRVLIPAWRLQRVTEVADNHLHEKLSIAILAEAAGLSVRHFARAFTQQVGETPHRWLMNLRIEKAKSRLAHSDDTITQIAQACGFSAQSHFTRVFKLMTGETPNQWRQWHKPG
ncbi:AraC family transcriptional regulator [Paraburkholderia rhizosphaerae]|uniref:AraC family transcriptional regulator n=1 Tax=Paraburkholderia rhizosphaerae TaxID=480658 RepID=A0A4R8LTF0_9BURK|nr:AraC family transcriptional regulator [Paraburkholderia rhizosphaerae]